MNACEIFVLLAILQVIRSASNEPATKPEIDKTLVLHRDVLLGMQTLRNLDQTIQIEYAQNNQGTKAKGPKKNPGPKKSPGPTKGPKKKRLTKLPKTVSRISQGVGS